MKKLTFLLIALVACAFVMSADEIEKPPMRSSIYDYDDISDVFERVGETSIFYDIAYRSAVGPGYQYGICILGEIFDDEGVPQHREKVRQLHHVGEIVPAHEALVAEEPLGGNETLERDLQAVERQILEYQDQDNRRKDHQVQLKLPP